MAQFTVVAVHGKRQVFEGVSLMLHGSPVVEAMGNVCVALQSRARVGDIVFTVRRQANIFRRAYQHAKQNRKDNERALTHKKKKQKSREAVYTRAIFRAFLQQKHRGGMKRKKRKTDGPRR